MKNNTPPNTTSDCNANGIYCTDELYVTETLYQSISPKKRTIKLALSTVPIKTKVLAMETDPDAHERPLKRARWGTCPPWTKNIKNL